MSMFFSLLIILAVMLGLHFGVKNFTYRVWAWISTLLAAGGLAILGAGNKLPDHIAEPLFQTSLVYLILGGFVGIFYTFINRGLHYAKGMWKAYSWLAKELHTKLEIPKGNMALLFQKPVLRGTYHGVACLVQHVQYGKYSFTGIRLEGNQVMPTLAVYKKGGRPRAVPMAWESLHIPDESKSGFVLCAPDPMGALDAWKQGLPEILKSYKWGLQDALILQGKGAEFALSKQIYQKEHAARVLDALKLLARVLQQVKP